MNIVILNRWNLCLTRGALSVVDTNGVVLFKVSWRAGA